MVVLVTGSAGQLGQSLQLASVNYPDIHFVFCTSQDLDITNFDACESVFSRYHPDYCINTAAYTAVDKAESDSDKAYAINVTGAKNLAEVCKTHDTVLLHISTDFVFNGEKTTPYTEEDPTHPTSVYGQTKLDGELAIQNILTKYYIFRTSWVYSQFGHNFMKTMLRVASERDSLTVVNDQVGTPTNANDLAAVLLKIIAITHQTPAAKNYGIYNYSNEGECSWYDFAQKIFEINHISINLQPIPTSSYPTPAKRPKYSVLDKSKIKNTFGIEIVNWEQSLENNKGK